MKGVDSLPTTTEILKMRDVDDDRGMVYGTQVHIFGGTGSLDGMVSLLNEIKKQRCKSHLSRS